MNEISFFQKLQRKIDLILKRLIISPGAYPPSHYYSPIPDQKEIKKYLKEKNLKNNELLDIQLNQDQQFSLLQEYSQYYDQLSFPENKNEEYRYYYENNYYSYSDAIFLSCFLRKHKPKKIVEVGSGFSSAVILDNMENVLESQVKFTLIEPDPERLFKLIKDNDKNQVSIITKKVQEVSLGIFSSLESGDLLFIDSSHVVKCGSDLQFIMFEIIPLLKSGVFVHFHDIFYPFEYPEKWLNKGIYWNENYFLRAFLAYNNTWKIYFFNHYIASEFENFIKEKMPLCLKNAGGSLYLRKT